MPIYEYQCQKCHHHLEALQKIADKPLRECPECGKHALKRLMSAPRFRLAGSGWYETDFKSDNEGKRNLAGKDEPAAPAADVAKSSETEAEPKPKAAAEPASSKPAAAAPTASKSASKPASKPASKAASKPAAKPVAKAKPAPRKAPAKTSRKR